MAYVLFLEGGYSQKAIYEDAHISSRRSASKRFKRVALESEKTKFNVAVSSCQHCHYDSRTARSKHYFFLVEEQPRRSSEVCGSDSSRQQEAGPVFPGMLTVSAAEPSYPTPSLCFRYLYHLLCRPQCPPDHIEFPDGVLPLFVSVEMPVYLTRLVSPVPTASSLS